jgi:hypothetical protein
MEPGLIIFLRGKTCVPKESKGMLGAGGRHTWGGEQTLIASCEAWSWVSQGSSILSLEDELAAMQRGRTWMSCTHRMFVLVSNSCVL